MGILDRRDRRLDFTASLPRHLQHFIDQFLFHLIPLIDRNCGARTAPTQLFNETSETSSVTQETGAKQNVTFETMIKQRVLSETRCKQSQWFCFSMFVECDQWTLTYGKIASCLTSGSETIANDLSWLGERAASAAGPSEPALACPVTPRCDWRSPTQAADA